MTGIRDKIQDAVPDLWNELSGLVVEWTNPIVERLNDSSSKKSFPKVFNDPVWGTIELLPHETLILDSPLLQRLRGVRQLGMAHHVYPGAVHDRLEHSRGVVEAASRMVAALARNAEHRKNYGKNPDAHIPQPNDMDKVSTRLAALLHDVGHGPFSHVIEPLVRGRYRDQIEEVERVLHGVFPGTNFISTSETLAVMIVLSQPMKAVLEHPNLEAVAGPQDLPFAIAARILGSRAYLYAQYLSGVINGPLDADKLDYMARDSHHSGLPLGLDIDRLITKLEVVTVTTDNAPVPELRDQAEHSANKRFYEIGVSASGLGAYEQMIVSRVILYDRVYFHHKVRASEAMVKRLFTFAEEQRGSKLSLREIFKGVPDDSVLEMLTAADSNHPPQGTSRVEQLGNAIRHRDIYHRAYAFAARFIDGLSGLPEGEGKDTRGLMWDHIVDNLSDLDSCQRLSADIYKTARGLSGAIDELKPLQPHFQSEHVIVDVPLNNVVARGSDILTMSESGDVGTPNLFFDPERWSEAYANQKQCGFVFAPRKFLPLVALASRVTFYNKFGVAMSPAADSICKTRGMIKDEWLRQAAANDLVSTECLAALTDKSLKLSQIRDTDLRLPDSWKSSDPGIGKKFASELAKLFPNGFVASIHKTLVDGIFHLTGFVEIIETGGTLSHRSALKERDLQELLLNHLRSRNVQVTESAKFGGGETDLILPGNLVLENKVYQSKTDRPLEVSLKYAWQARRYGIAVCRSIFFVVMAYKPETEAGILPQQQRVCMRKISDDPTAPEVEIRFVIPWGFPSPSRAKTP